MTGGRLRVTADTDRCVAAGSCVRHALKVFDQDDFEGRVVVLAEYPDEESWEAVYRAVDSCPAQALQVFENEATATR